MQHFLKLLFLTIKEFLKMYMVSNGYGILLLFLLVNHRLTVLLPWAVGFELEVSSYT